MTSVKVEKYPFGIVQFSECLADVTDDDLLTVTCVEDDRVMQTFPAGTWRTAAVFSERGLPLYAYVSRASQDEQLQRVEDALASVRKRGSR